MTSVLFGEYLCRRGCGRVLTMPGALARHEKVCIRTLDDLIRRAGIEQTDGCWEWPGSTGRVKVPWTRPWSGKPGLDYIYRVAYYLFYGEFDQKLLVCHHCDNGLCFNPGHLFVGTASDNQRDMATKGRCSFQQLSHEQRQAYGRLAARATFEALGPEGRKAKATAAARARWDKRVHDSER